MNCLQAEGETEVLVPGDTERQHMASCDKQGGIAYQPKQIEWAVSAICYSLPAPRQIEWAVSGVACQPRQIEWAVCGIAYQPRQIDWAVRGIQLNCKTKQIEWAMNLSAGSN